MARDDFKVYDLMAIHAGLTCGLAIPTVAQAAAMGEVDRAHWVARVADDTEAAKLRDSLYLEFERRCMDPGYRGDQVFEWFKDNYGPISRSSFYRARSDVRARHSGIEDAASQARAFIELAESEGADSCFAGFTARAGQLAFELIMETQARDLKTGDPAKLAKLLEAIGKLAKAKADIALVKAREAEIQRKLDAEKRQADQKAEKVLSDSGVTVETINQIRQIYGLKPVAQLVEGE
jgi:hypothetical protein